MTFLLPEKRKARVGEVCFQLFLKPDTNEDLGKKKEVRECQDEVFRAFFKPERLNIPWSL